MLNLSQLSKALTVINQASMIMRRSQIIKKNTPKEPIDWGEVYETKQVEGEYDGRRNTSTESPKRGKRKRYNRG